MRKGLFTAVAVLVAGCSPLREDVQPVRIEFRAASLTPGSDLTEMKEWASDRTVYVSPTVLLSNEDIASATAVSDVAGPRILVTMTPEGAKRFTAATEQNLMKPIAILAGGQLLCAPVVREKIVGGKAEISGRFTMAEAKKIAKGIKAR